MNNINKFLTIFFSIALVFIVGCSSDTTVNEVIPDDPFANSKNVNVPQMEECYGVSNLGGDMPVLVNVGTCQKLKGGFTSKADYIKYHNMKNKPAHLFHK